MRQPAPDLALPAELHRRRADHDGRIGVVGLERRERLDGLAEPLLVGDECPPRIQRVADPSPLERRKLAAESSPRSRRSGRRSARGSGRPPPMRPRARRAVAEGLGRESLDLDTVRSDERHRVRRRSTGPAPPSGFPRPPGSSSNARPTSGSQITSRRSCSPSHAAQPGQAGGRRLGRRQHQICRQRSAAASSARRLLLAQDGGGGRRQRHEQTAVVHAQIGSRAARTAAARPTVRSTHQPRPS